jgi:hypothetical protein
VSDMRLASSPPGEWCNIYICAHIRCDSGLQV